MPVHRGPVEVRKNLIVRFADYRQSIAGLISKLLRNMSVLFSLTILFDALRYYSKIHV